ncbi:hypothetical protein TREMEDRAFT_35234 [Tremella mesenterica DSM 1558]|uniref:uncharacterized protein n=1 Tax=Tremella mesenterica (strain ATCC 24925 / CBS 8224 / DSM 1558 / NBRC 9311 / NRRL Y-6157 / RJB 2259-6 / UBC 559-6) TaxID=578456 RepID=UPI00032CDA0C|nr:uncharacterized protein TREMEDRAFT_35234 [Tremella mesenterica DSM 1558]EIW66292.1 hypothetical protein TREMEDRAFT_35234 [Tremella mesenterica DSM 1558]
MVHTPPRQSRPKLQSTIYDRYSHSTPISPFRQSRFPLTPPETPNRPIKEAQELYTNFSALTFSQPTVQSRLLSDNELSYFLPSRQDGVNDMYLHHSLIAPRHLFTIERILNLWAYLLLKHPLLASTVDIRSWENVQFLYNPPASLEVALQKAEERLCIIPSGGDIIDSYLNGPRTLSPDRLAMLVITIPDHPPSPSTSPRYSGDYDEEKYEVMLCATHYLGDGMALHTLMNDFYTLLASPSIDFYDLIEPLLATPSRLPVSLEDRLPQSRTRLEERIGVEEYQRSEKSLIGGQSFPMSKIKRERKTVVPTLSYSERETKEILGKCKTNGVTIAHAVFALCSVAWSRLTEDCSSPCMFYSALNLRPQLTPSSDSFFHLAVGYFNIVLPSLLPSIPTGDLLWHRAKETKRQTVKAVKSPFLISRARETNKIRRTRAVKWAMIDDAQDKQKVETRTGPSQKALMGLSMLGNLDTMYKHQSFPSIHLESLTTGSRQRSGGLLLFAYTFKGKLWFSLGYDMNGFEDGVIERFWEEVHGLVKEVMLSS